MPELLVIYSLAIQAAAKLFDKGRKPEVDKKLLSDIFIILLSVTNGISKVLDYCGNKGIYKILSDDSRKFCGTDEHRIVLSGLIIRFSLPLTVSFILLLIVLNDPNNITIKIRKRMIIVTVLTALTAVGICVIIVMGSKAADTFYKNRGFTPAPDVSGSSFIKDHMDRGDYNWH